ncbi:MAG: efflux RND transporter periplasmic adaptor subunit [Marinifilaceae bacterium]|nr:efflux RND transporter periplasmic adaptor subunit [Marinifilaceae bacterium]
MNFRIFTIAVAICYTLLGCKGNTHNHDSHEHEHAHEHEQHNHDHNHEHEHEHEHEHSHEQSDVINFTCEQAELIGLTTETIKAGEFTDAFKVGGKIVSAPGDATVIVARSSGTINFIDTHISEGMKVTKGSPIMQITPAGTIDGNPIAKAENEYKASLADYNRAKELVKDQIISQREYEQCEQRFLDALNAYNDLKDEHADGNVNVTSPINGYITEILVDEGDYIEAGTILGKVSQNNSLQIIADVTEKNYSRLKKIKSANFKVSYSPKLFKLSELQGKLVSYGRNIETDYAFIHTTFEFDNTGELIPGSYAEIYLLAESQPNTISVPVSALLEEQGLYFVYIMTGHDQYKKVQVETGGNNGERIEILKGLKNDEIVVTKGVYNLKLAEKASIIPEGHSHNH